MKQPEQSDKTMKKNKIPRPKQTYTPKLRYDTFQEAFLVFVTHHCVNATLDWNVHQPPYVESEIRVVLNSRGGGYIHLLGQDSETIDFKTI